MHRRRVLSFRKICIFLQASRNRKPYEFSPFFSKYHTINGDKKKHVVGTLSCDLLLIKRKYYKRKIAKFTTWRTIRIFCLAMSRVYNVLQNTWTIEVTKCCIVIFVHTGEELVWIDWPVFSVYIYIILSKMYKVLIVNMLYNERMN